MGNRLNYRCPKCGSPDKIDIEAIVSVRLTNTGTEGDASNCGPEDWTGENAASCDACGYFGTVDDFEPAGVIITVFEK
jgi:hypothetical protein